MSSRRIRLKAVINLPQRRGKEQEPASVETVTPDSDNAKRKADSVDESSKTNLVETQDTSANTPEPSSVVRKRLKPTVNLPSAVARKPKHVRFSEPIAEEKALITNSEAENSELEDIERLPERNVHPEMEISDEFVVPTSKNIPPKSPKNLGPINNIPPPVVSNLPSQKPVGKSYSRLSRPSPRLLVNTAMRSRPHSTNDPPEVPDLPSPLVADTVPSDHPSAVSPNLPSTPPVHQDEPLDSDFVPSVKASEKRTTHRRLRKNGAGEMLTKARRDFHMKFGNKTPDKKQLTMFDLIFYNPSTNPMKPQETNTPDKDRCPKKSDDTSERLAEESVDDVNVATSDEEPNSAMPAPQVKVGPDGSLIIDEKSLVIETTGAQKRRFELANSAVVMDYGIGNSTTYSSFTNRVKSKEWSKQETLKFYRALNSVGTDFLLMQSIFPKRTRKDLKQKFKKEDRLNRDLVDKALKYPAEFDVAQLEKDLAQEEKENEEKRQRELLMKMAKEGLNKPKRASGKKGQRSKVVRSFLEKSLDSTELVSETPQSSNITELQECEVGSTASQAVTVAKPFTGKKSRKARLRIRRESSSSSSSSDEECIYSDGELHYEPTSRLQQKSAAAVQPVEVAVEGEDSQEIRLEANATQECLVEANETHDSIVEANETRESIVEESEAQESIVEESEAQESLVEESEAQEITMEAGVVSRESAAKVLQPQKSTNEEAPPVVRALSTADDVDFSSSDDEITFLKTTRQTRYGRIPQRRVLSSESEEEEEEETVDKVEPERLSYTTASPDLTHVEPGSIVIIASPGRTSYQLFMVGPREEDTGKSKMTPIGVSLTPEVLATMTNNVQVLGEPLVLKDPETTSDTTLEAS